MPIARGWPRSARLGWFLGMQNQDGGWASFDADNNRIYLNNIPFADHGALLDPSTEDLTGRGLELLGTLATAWTSSPAIARSTSSAARSAHDGPWYGRWGVNYIYGTWSVLRGLAAVGADPRQEFIQRAVRWLVRHQNADGGWGETCESYATRAGRTRRVDAEPDRVGVAGLFAAGTTSGPAVRGGHRLSAPHAEAGRRRGKTRSGTARGFPASSTSSTTCTRATSRSGLWASIATRMHD